MTAATLDIGVSRAVQPRAELRNDLQLIAAMIEPRTRFCVISFTSDWLYPTSENRMIVHALNAAAANVSFVEVETDKGHDAFLLDEPEFHATLRGFLDGCAEHRGLLRR